MFTGFPAFSVIRYQSGYPAMSHPVSSRIPDKKTKHGYDMSRTFDPVYTAPDGC